MGGADPRKDLTLRQLLQDILDRSAGFHYKPAKGSHTEDAEASGGMGWDGMGWDGWDVEAVRAQWWDWLQSEQLVTPTETDKEAFVMSDKGRCMLRVGESIRNNRKILKPRPGVAFTEQSTWELMVHLNGAGWEHRHLRAGSKKTEPHGPGSDAIEWSSHLSICTSCAC